MSVITNTYQNKSTNFQKVNKQIIDFTHNCGCSEKDAFLFLKRGRFDFDSSVVLFTLTRLISQPQRALQAVESRTKKILTEVNYSNSPLGRNELQQKPKERMTDTIRGSNVFNLETTRCPINLQPLTFQDNSFLYDEGKPLEFEGLKRYLTQKPSPPWRERLRAFKMYDQELVMGFPEALYTHENIILDKNIFKLYLDINNGEVSSKNLQRGVTAYLERIGFNKIQNRSRTFMEFYWSKSTTKKKKNTFTFI
ncbi:hypothetical protein M0813_17861 [Anaeramoeba flamelloides]|uniref:Uncharacterized protein n=1 Tax=Anaeramoeba flamelloides TaxID=1746091 RepID=A0ABQ8YUC3_9EUKA|nr:hypothetical protein M0813_17861 [Anaeramoeba flamelloides]